MAAPTRPTDSTSGPNISFVGWELPNTLQFVAQKGSAEKKMDGFEVRVRFTDYLRNLNASVTSANKAAQYALKYKDFDDDLHSCILEQLQNNGMNVRANIMYFIEYLCDAAKREKNTSYVRMMQRDILQMVDAVAPEDGSGAANVKVVRKVLQGLQSKDFLLAQTVTEIEESLAERDTQPDASSPTMMDIDMPTDQRAPGRANGRSVEKLDKKQVEQRIEEDRERHKRLRENIWAIPPGGENSELSKAWDETSDLGDDDYMTFEEEELEKENSSAEWSDSYKNGRGTY